MKHKTVAPPPLTIREIFLFEPWPFENEEILVATHVGYVDESGSVRHNRDVVKWALESRLAVLSDDTTVVLSDEYDVSAPLEDKR